MIEKDRLLGYIDEALRTEESAVEIYAKHLQAVLAIAGFSQDERRRIHKALREIERETQRHKATMEEIREQVMEDPRHAF